MNKLLARPRHISDIVTIFLVCFMAYFLPSALRPLANPDEGRYSEIPREMAASGDWVTPHLNGVEYFYKPPLFYWAQALSIETFGINLYSLRFANVMFAIFGVIFTYIAIRSIYDRITGIFAAAVLGTCLFYFAIANIILLDMAVSVLISATLFSFIIAWREKESLSVRNFWWILFFIFCALSVMAKGLIGIAIPGAIIFFYLLATLPFGALKQIRKSDLLIWSFGALIFLAITAPWHIMAALANPATEASQGFFSTNPEGQGWLWYYVMHEHILRYIDTETSHRGEPFWFFFLLAPIGFIPWVVFLPRALWREIKLGYKKMAEKPELIFFAIWALFVLFFFSISKSKLPPYILPMFPAMSVFVALLLAKAWYKPSENPIFAERIALIALSSVGVVALPLAYFIIRKEGAMISPNMAIFPFATAALLLLITIGFLSFYFRKKKNRRFIFAAFVSTIMFMSMIPWVGKYVQRADTSEFAQIIKSMRAPSDRVIAAHCYGDVQDLPLWLEEPITLYGRTNHDNPRGITEEQYFGYMRAPEKYQSRYLTKPEMKDLLDAEDVFVVSKENVNIRVFSPENPKKPLREIARKGKLVLYTNKAEKTK